MRNCVVLRFYSAGSCIRGSGDCRIVVFGVGIATLIPELAVGLALVGTGLILTVLGVIATVASVKLCLVVFPGICRGIVWICRRPFQGKAVA